DDRAARALGGRPGGGQAGARLRARGPSPGRAEAGGDPRGPRPAGCAPDPPRPPPRPGRRPPRRARPPPPPRRPRPPAVPVRRRRGPRCVRPRRLSAGRLELLRPPPGGGAIAGQALLGARRGPLGAAQAPFRRRPRGAGAPRGVLGDRDGLGRRRLALLGAAVERPPGPGAARALDDAVGPAQGEALASHGHAAVAPGSPLERRPEPGIG